LNDHCWPELLGFAKIQLTGMVTKSVIAAMRSEMADTDPKPPLA